MVDLVISTVMGFGTSKDLSTNEQNPIELIHWKSVYDQLEALLNASESVVDVISGLVIKNS